MRIINILFSTFTKKICSLFLFLEINVHFPFLMQKAMAQTQSGITSSFRDISAGSWVFDLNLVRRCPGNH